MKLATEQRRLYSVRWLFGASISVTIAALMTLLLRGTQRSVLAPIVFLLVIILCAKYFGVIAGMLGSIFAAVLFALYLFEPFGSFQVHDRQALSNLGLLLFAGIALSYANSDRDEDREPRHRVKPH
jgi:K+-sensing histidine kinase KdpD